MFIGAIGAGLAGVAAWMVTKELGYVLLAAWDGFIVAFLAVLWRDLRGHTSKSTAAAAMRDEPGRSLSDIVLLVSSVASLGAIGVLLAVPHKPVAVVLFAIVSVVLSWAMVHSIYMLRYAVLYYGVHKGGIDFGGSDEPTFDDFAYLAFTLGMTYQVSDTTFVRTEFRRVALRHALLSFMFGVVIIAVSINFLASLGQ